jgi:type IV secretion system protein VirB6
MAGVCPAPDPSDPLVRSLLGVVDCNVQQLVRGGYDALFQPSGVFPQVLTVLLTLYVAFVGYQLLLGRAQLNVSDFALTAVKLSAVVALATQWSAYQALIYHVLFFGPQQVADIILHSLGDRGATAGGDVFDGLQRAFTDLTSFSPAQPPGAAAASVPVGGGGTPLNPTGGNGAGMLSTLLTKAGFDAELMLASAVVLMISSLGVLLAAKIVLGMLLATGPVFIAMLLFEGARGVFIGWLRACLGFAFAPLAVTLMLGVALTLLEPSLQQIETMQATNVYPPGVAFGVVVLVTVFAAVSIGIVIAGGVIAGGLSWPRRSAVQLAPGAAVMTTVTPREDLASRPRSARIAAAVAAQGRRDAMLFDRPSATAALGAGERRTTISTTVSRADRAPALETRLGQAARRNAAPHAARSGLRSIT